MDPFITSRVSTELGQSQSLHVLFSAPFGEHLVFKGGTSLSKAYGAIRRFSEDVDLTYDIRQIAPDLTGSEAQPLPKTGNQEKKWTKTIRERLPKWVESSALDTIRRAIAAEQVPALAKVDPSDNSVILVEYESISTEMHYVRPVVMLEFGARSTGEPSDVRPVQCDAAEFVPVLTFPTASPRVMRVERTFWEKATAIHVFCLRGKGRGDKYSRHWYDLVELDTAGHVQPAIEDRGLALQVAQHKNKFFAEKAADGTSINYEDAVHGRLRLTPEGEALVALKEDYQKMVDDGLLLDVARPFDELLERCRQIERRANELAKA